MLTLSRGAIDGSGLRTMHLVQTRTPSKCALWSDESIRFFILFVCLFLKNWTQCVMDQRQKESLKILSAKGLKTKLCSYVQRFKNYISCLPHKIFSRVSPPSPQFNSIFQFNFHTWIGQSVVLTWHKCVENFEAHTPKNQQ